MIIKKFSPMFSADLGSTGSTETATTTETAPTPEAPEAPKADSPMIPKTRFDEVNKQAKELAAKVEAFEKAQAEAEKQRQDAELQAQKEQGKFEELYTNTQKELESYKKYESRTTELESLIQNMVATKLESVPEAMVDLVPTNLNVEQTLDWLNKAEAKGLFGTAKPEPKEIGKPSNKSNESPKVDSTKISAMDKILQGLGK